MPARSPINNNLPEVRLQAHNAVQLVLCPGNTRTKSGDFLEDRIGGSRPDERATGTIVALYEGIDFLDEVVDTGERTTANGTLGDQSEPALHLVAPRGIGGG